MSITWDSLSDKLTSYAKAKRIPLSGTFELTPRCNLQCKMCYICQPSGEKTAIERELTALEWINLAREARNSGVLYLVLTGGEVFLRKDFREIYEQLSQMGFSIQIYTNATLITREIAQWLAKIPPSKVSITLYGASPETYEKVCGDAKAYERAVRGIDLLLSEGVKVEVKTTVVQGNVNDFDEICKFVDARDVQFGIVNYISPRREGCNTEPEAQRLSPEALVEYERRVEQYNDRKRAESHTDKNKKKDSEESRVSGIRTVGSSTDKNDPFRCTAGKCAFWISWDGRMLPCGLLDFPEIKPDEKGFLGAWEDLKQSCSRIPVCAECINCSVKEYCMSCPARLMTEMGVYDRPAPYLCEMAQRRNEANTTRMKETQEKEDIA